MKAIAVIPEKRSIEIIDVEEPQIRHPQEVKVQILEVGICGTDREIAQFQYGTPPPGEKYLVLGHESLGRVVATGEKVTRVKRGDLVALSVRRGCKDNCISCINNQSDMCYTGNFVERGIKEAHGFMASYVVEEERYAARLPEELSDIGVLLEPLTIIEKAVKETFQIQSRLHWECQGDKGQEPYGCRTALVLGAGPVGFLGALLLKMLGFRTFVLSRQPKGNPRSQLLASAGIGYFSSQEDSPETVLKELGQGERTGNIDIILEATGSSQLSFDLLPVLGTNGVFVFTGIPGRRQEFTIDGDSLMKNIVLKNQIILGSVNANITAFETGVGHLMEFKKRFPLIMRKMITARVSFDQYQDYLYSKREDEIKTVLVFPG